MVSEPLNVWEFERLAEERLDPAAFGYFAGGAGDEVTLRENVEAFGRLTLRPRVLADVSGVSTAATVLGHDVSMPIGVAPVAFQRLAHPEGEVATARAAARAGTIFSLSTVATASPAEITDGVRFFQLYVFKDRGFTRALIEQAVDAGFSAILLTADTPHLGRRERDHRTGFKIPAELVPSLAGHDLLTPEQTFASMADDLSWRDVEELASMSGLPVLVKGVLTTEDALLACESGAAGVVVSNHGGRQLDGVPATIEALPEVVGGRRRARPGADGRRDPPRHRRRQGARARRSGGAGRAAVRLGPRRRRRGRRLPRPRASTRRAGARARAPRLQVPVRGDAGARQESLNTSIVPE